MTKFVEQHKTFRLLLHIPVGIINVLMLFTHPVLGLIFFLSFGLYEICEDWHIRDGSYLDFSGYLWGLALGGIGWNIMAWIR